MSKKIPMTSSGIELAPFRFLAQHLNLWSNIPKINNEQKAVKAPRTSSDGKKTPHFPGIES